MSLHTVRFRTLPMLLVLFLARDTLSPKYLPLKPWPNDRNLSTQHIPTLSAEYLQARAKRSNISAALLDTTRHVRFATL